MVAETNTAIKERLAEAQATGETVTVHYQYGRTHRFTATCRGTVDTFVKRPREAEKVRIQRAGQALIRCDVPLRAIVVIEGAVAAGMRL